MGRGIARIEVERLPIVSDGLIECARVLQDIGEIVVQRRMSRVESKSSAQHILGLIQPSERAQQAACIVDRGRVARPRCERGVECRHGGGEIARFLVRSA